MDYLILFIIGFAPTLLKCAWAAKNAELDHRLDMGGYWLSNRLRPETNLRGSRSDAALPTRTPLFDRQHR